MPNYNEKTGIPFGILLANNVPELLNDITMHGDDLTMEDIREEMKSKLEGAVTKAIDDVCYNAEFVAGHLAYDDLLDELENGGLWDGFESDEHNYEYSYETKKGEVKLGVFWLGGAPHIRVYESPFIARCSKCSPCVPGAGDLDAPREDGGYAHCLPAEDMPDNWKGTVELFDDPTREV